MRGNLFLIINEKKLISGGTYIQYIRPSLPDDGQVSILSYKPLKAKI